jgi:hypothetical protein
VNGTDAIGNSSPSNVTVTDTTKCTKQATADARAIAQGTCIAAHGTKDGGGTLAFRTMLEPAAKSHRAIAAAVAAKDGQKAHRRMEQHLDAALRYGEASGLRGAPMIPPSRWRGDNSDLPWR